MPHRLLIPLLGILFVGWNRPVQAQVSFTLTSQNAISITTQSLSTASVCAGTTLTVPFLVTGTANTTNSYEVQLGTGITYVTVPSGIAAAPSSTTGAFSLTATIPANTTAGNNYRVRVVTTDLLAVGSPSPTTLTVRASPTAPVTQSVAICQSIPVTSLTLTATGQNLLWYTAPSTGTGVSVAPVVSTSLALRTAYYVTQTANGCESPRTSLSVLVTATPASPTVASAGPVYCQNAVAQSLTAIGVSLTWYSSLTGGAGVGSVVPSTTALGNTTYYVSQRISGCESPRTSLVVSVSAVPTAPIVASLVSVCQRSTPTTLTATGTNLKWYSSPSGTSLSAAPSPPTDNTGTVGYFVAQSNGVCESSRAEIRVMVKPTPTAPFMARQVVCQNSPAVTLTAQGQNIRWYASPISTIALAGAPTVNTSLAVVTIYYPTQTVDGCESQRGEASVLVKPLPLPPTPTPTNYCQFVRAQPVSATSSGMLRWFNNFGDPFDTPPTPITDQPASFTYLVSQTVEGCESPKAALVVNILSTPPPTVAKPVVELCQNGLAQPLEATGRGLRWIDPANVVSATAPVPPTYTPTTKPEGELYYVTQTGENGCESTRATIRVFVQPLPTLNLSGTTTTNIGLEVPIRLIFAGKGPFQYKLSNGLTGTATKDTNVLVLPTRTTTYQVTEIRNACGLGAGSGSVTVTVNIPSIQTLALANSTICVGTSFTAAFTQNGSFNAGSVFRLQYARPETDSAKIQYVEVLNSTQNGSQLTGTIPTTLAAGSYWVRVVATNPKIPIHGTVSPTLLTVRPLPTATLAGSQTIYETEPARLTVAFTGDGPWTFTYRDSTTTTGPVRQVQATSNPYILDVRPSKTATYWLMGITNQCGTGLQSTTPALVTVLPLLSVEDPILSNALTVFPIPATHTVTVRIEGLMTSETALLELLDRAGRSVWSGQTRQRDTVVSMENQPGDVYVLRVQIGKKRASRRVVKL